MISVIIWKHREYKNLHKQSPKKDLYILHTSNEKVEIMEQFFSGIRGSI